MSDQPKSGTRRPYTLRRRLAQLDETKERITAAAFGLHATIGPSRTTISAIAERAGVQRHTVYHHFPDLEALYEACTAHGMRVTGIPQAADWVVIEDPRDRLRRGLTDLYAYYRANERMLATILGDAGGSEPPTEPDLFEQHMATLSKTLVDPWPKGGDADPTLTAMIAHAMGFDTWRSLTRAGLSDDEARDLLLNVVVGIAQGTLSAASPR
jgi:AcrR family transcriptional regulator